MKCLNCSHEDTKILDTRVSSDGMYVRRRRMCDMCGYRFTTTEIREVLDLMVIKKNGIKERYSKEKLIKGIETSLQKRPVTKEKIRSLCLKIENELIKNNEKEITSSKIGDTVLLFLKDIDEVAYIRFASIYKDFKTINGFKKEIEKFIKN